MLSLSEKKDAMHDAFDCDEIELVRMGLKLVKGKLEKLKKDEEALGQAAGQTKRSLRLIEGTDTAPGLLSVFVQVDAVETTQVDAFRDEEVEEEALEECPHENALYDENGDLACQDCGQIIVAEEEEVEEAPVPTRAEIDAARAFLAKQQGEVGASEAWNPDSWTERPPDGVVEALAHIADVGWAQAGKDADEAYGEPVTEASDNEAPEGPGEEAEEATGATEAGGDIPGDSGQWVHAGDDLPRGIPFRGSLIKSGLSLRELRARSAGELTEIDGIGNKGAVRIHEFLEKWAEKWGDPSAAAEEELQEEDEGDPPEPTTQDLLDMLRDGQSVVFEGNTLRVLSGWEGHQLELETAEGKELAPERAVLSKAALLVLARRLLDGESTWKGFKEEERAPGSTAAGSDTSNEEEEEATTRTPPQIGDRIAVQVPHKPAESVYIGGFNVDKPQTANVYSEVELNERGLVVSKTGLLGRVEVQSLSWTPEPGLWSVHVSKIEVQEG